MTHTDLIRRVLILNAVVNGHQEALDIARVTGIDHRKVYDILAALEKLVAIQRWRMPGMRANHRLIKRTSRTAKLRDEYLAQLGGVMPEPETEFEEPPPVHYVTPIRARALGLPVAPRGY